MMKPMKFQDWALLWLENKKPFVKQATYANYLILMKNQLIPRIGSYDMKEITKDVIQKMILDLRSSGRLDGKGGLSDKTVKDLIMILKMCLKDYGISDSCIFQKNAFRYPVNNGIHKMEVMDELSCQKMLEAIAHHLNNETLGYAVSLYTGMRIGEICALQWKDIDMEHRMISVSKTLQRIYLKNEGKGHSEIIIGMPKSRSAIREIPMANALAELLDAQKCDAQCYLVSGTTKYLEPRLYRKHFSDFLKENGLEHMRFHDLRHTFATRCIEKGADCKTVSCLLGHSSVNITLNRYVHPQMEKKRACVELV